MDDLTIKKLLADLQNPSEEVRDRATQIFWEQWFCQKGSAGLERLQRSQALMDSGEIEAAEAILTALIQAQPDFAEAWNRRSVLYYTQKQYVQALQDCQKVLSLVPFHFGALHGLGLCYAAVGDYPAAVRAFHRALEVQPHALINQKLLLECSARL
ncbi:tetratricopeptide repeat protein [Synechococcales cyanobacterium C]|uniref:Tetratricopeptide repeat protein n=1 Tax=Petrachloros mirabilis ULC683 TaxID=2781853 RepID=A0A8K2AND5_9CYAN|nr:tetratricopeptide repeat protein [Petrachloros mirabilis]NCJ05496.1 tetratricopeptide repeat protein [Petrachloros mirabilis ULC683]